MAMKYSYFCILVIFAFPFKLSGQTGVPSSASILGKLVNYTLFSANGAVSATGTSQIIGNVGANAGSLSGFNDQTLIGTAYFSNAETDARTSDLQAALSSINNIPVTATHIPTMGGGEILSPGVYSIAGAGSIAGILTLDAGGDANAMFIIKLGGALTTGANTEVVLTGGAASCNVIWSVEGAIAMAASTTMVGTLIANNGAISMGAGNKLDGRLLATMGAVSIASSNAVKPSCDCATPAPTVVSPLYYCQNTRSLPITAVGTNLTWGNGNTTNPTPSTATLGSSTYYVTQTVNGCIGRPAAITVIVFAGPSATVVYNDNPFRSDQQTAIMTHTGTSGGRYASTPGLSIDSLNGNVNIEYSLPGSYIVTYTIAASNDGCYLYEVSTPLDIVSPPSINIGSLADFVLFTTSGTINNAGISKVASGIGTHAGTVDGFASSTVNGAIHIADDYTATGARELNNLYNQLTAQLATRSHPGSLGSDEVLTSAVYQIAAAAAITGNLNFDADGDPSAIFIIKIGGALTSAAGAKVNLINGACAGNIYWIVNGAISMAVQTSLAGTFLSHDGAIFMGTGGIINGRLYSTNGAISINEFSSSITKCPSDALWIGAVSTDWYDAANWRYGNIPDSLTNTTLAPSLALYPIVTTGLVAVKKLTLGVGSALTVNNAEITISGSINNYGILNLTQGTLTLNGKKPQSLKTSSFITNLIHNLNINNSSGVSLDGALNISGILGLKNGQLNTGGNLTLSSTALQTALIDANGTGNINGKLTMQRYLAAGFGYKYFSSPFTDATVSYFANVVNLNQTFPNFYNYIEDKASAGFTAYTQGTSLLYPFTGYAADFGPLTTPQLVSITGTVNNGPITSFIYNHNRPYTNGFNLIGNPYPSPIDWNLSAGWTKTNIDDAIYFFNSGNTDQYSGTYSTYVNGISSDGIASNIITSMQGFFVHVSNGNYPVTGSLSINNSARVNNLTAVFHKSIMSIKTAAKLKTPPTVLRLSIALSGHQLEKDPMVIYFDAAASTKFNHKLDALKFKNFNGVPNVYSLKSDGSKVAISAIPQLDSLTVIPIGIETTQEGIANFSLNKLEYWPNDRPIFLLDAKTGISKELKLQESLSFNIQSGVTDNRFSLLFSAPKAAIKGVDDDGFKVTGSKNKLNATLNFLQEQKGFIMVSDIMGNVLSKTAVDGNGNYEIQGTTTNKLYMVSFFSPYKRYTRKIIVSER